MNQGMYQTAATTQGVVDGTLSMQWAARPDDQRFLDLPSLRDAVRSWADESTEIDFKASDLRAVHIDGSDIADLRLAHGDSLIAPTHWSFGQIAQLAGAPAKYLRKLPARLAATNLNYGLRANGAAENRLYVRRPADGMPVLRANTSQTYGRIRDFEVVEKVMEVAAMGSWKVPGEIAWGKSADEGMVWYDPNVPVTKRNTTLYASDRDVFMFLCDDLNPIEIGTLANGRPDLLFRGFMVSNSEVGAATFTLKTMLLRGVCCNRNLWGVQDATEMTIRHTASAPEKFIEVAGPALIEYSFGSAKAVVAKVDEARAITFTGPKEERRDEQMKLLVDRLKFGKKAAMAILATDPDGSDVVPEDLPANLWQLTQAATAWARDIPYTDLRIDAEEKIGRLMAKV